MKKKNLLGLAAVALILVAALVFGLPLLSRLIYGRSQAATLFARQLKKEAYTTEESFEAYLEEKREENAAPYELPYDDWRGEAPELCQLGGLECIWQSGGVHAVAALVS